MIYLRKLVEAISLFKGVKNVFLIINYIKSGLRFSVINCQIFNVKIFENHISRIFLRRGGFLVLLFLGGCAVLVRHLVLHRYFGYCRFT